MGEIQATGQKRAFYQINGQKKCIEKWIKDGDNEKISGIEGFIIGMKIRWDLNSEGAAKTEIILLMADVKEPTEEDEVMYLSFNEGTYLAERIINKILNIPHQDKVTVLVYESQHFKNAPGVSIKQGGKQVSYRFEERDESGDTVGVPKGKAEDRVDFWRNLLFTDAYTNLLGEEWDGVIEESNRYKEKMNGGDAKAAVEDYSPETTAALANIKKKAEKYEDSKSLANAWKAMLQYIKDNEKKDKDKEAQSEAQKHIQSALDAISGDETYRLNSDGSWVLEDLPF